MSSVTWSNGQTQGTLAPTQTAPAATGVNRSSAGRSQNSRGMMNKGHTGTSGGNSTMAALAAQFAGLGPITRGGRRRTKHRKTRRVRKTRSAKNKTR